MYIFSTLVWQPFLNPSRTNSVLFHLHKPAGLLRFHVWHEVPCGLFAARWKIYRAVTTPRWLRNGWSFGLGIICDRSEVKIIIKAFSTMENTFPLLSRSGGKFPSSLRRKESFRPVKEGIWTSKSLLLLCCFLNVELKNTFSDINNKGVLLSTQKADFWEFYRFLLLDTVLRFCRNESVK